ncbi:outer membrane beta-barrel family protein [Sphingobacterium sp. UME9]|uniref:outer membrane beta-barrel family protein n=1 Tax=Sphingobacterium sp. UME9 TaxID=1862316 RepID=UPI0016045017|nr:outer membrane beta-barrel family protein [Sphingobacterium sp. UME9]MBB1644328.1 TonB-dependent receptor [Sphingobacterium sp. UME9]
MKLILFFLAFPLLLSAQTKQIGGQVQDANKIVLAGATVMLLDSNYQEIREVKTDHFGKFILTLDHPNGYYLRTTYLNFKSQELFFRSDTISRPLLLELLPEAKVLEEAQVVGRAPRLIRKLDRLEFNVQNSNLSALNSWDILKRTPLVMVNGADLMVRGNKNIVVLINDRKVMLTGDELKTYLENTAGSDVQSIEVITNPPAKYEAEGSTIINIKLSKSNLYGYRGTVVALAEKSSTWKQLFGLTQYYKNEKFNLRGTYNFGRGTYARYETNYVYYPNEQTSWEGVMDRFDTNNSQNSYVFSIDYTPDTTWTVNAGLNGYYGPKTYGIYEVPTIIYDKNHVQESSYFTTNDHQRSTKTNNLYLQVTKKLNSRWSINWSSYFTDNHSTNDQDVLTALRFKGEEPTDTRFISNNGNKNRLFSSQIDFTGKIKNLGMEFGGKFSDVKTTSTLVFFDDESGELEQRSDKSSVFDYKERNVALYGSLDYAWKKWSWKAGLRGEYTDLEGIVSEPADINKRDYFVLFPTFYMQYALTDDQQFGFSYGKRISRPSYSWLNPAKSYYNRFSYFQGDPRLRATIVHNLNLTWTKNNWNIDLFYRFEKWPNMEISRQDNNNHQLIFQYTNIKKGQGAGIDLGKSFQLTGRWGLNLQLEGMYNQNYFMGTDDVLHKNDVYIGNGNVSTNYVLNKDAGWNLELGNTFTSPTIQGPFNITGYSSTYVTTNRKFFKKKFEVNLSFMDIFKTEKMTISSKYGDQNNFYRDYRDTRKVNLTLRYHFGNQKVKSSNQPTRTEEQNRL